MIFPKFHHNKLNIFIYLALLMQSIEIICKELLWETSTSFVGDDFGEHEFASHHHYHLSKLKPLPNVTTVSGIVRGRRSRLDSGRDVYEFLGIPFAKAPIKEYRFKKPIPIGSWSNIYETYDAVKLPKSCQQTPRNVFPNLTNESMFNPNTRFSEDCLYLNIWIPASIFNRRDKSKDDKQGAAILFWIHDGEFHMGSSSLSIYNGSKLADENDVIVVSTQYRLGPFGFLYLGNDSGPANVGLLDQNLALQWIYYNIESFGGNPELITLIGQDAGAASISYHILSPLSQPFFERAILMSGIALAPWAFQTPVNALENSYKLAKIVGCGSLDKKTQAEIAKCLEEISVDKILDAQNQMFEETFVRFPFVPTVDKQLVNDIPKNLIQKAAVKVRKDIIIGNVQDEGSMYIQYNFIKNLTKVPSLTRNEFLDVMNIILGAGSPCHNDFITNYYTNWENPNDGTQNLQRVMDAAGDNLITCPSKVFADTWANFFGNNVFYYYFTQRTSSSPWPLWMGVVHGSELEYIFGLPIPNISHTKEEIQLSKHMMNLFSEFAKTGIPSLNWKPYSKETSVYLNLNATKISNETTFNIYGPRANACTFWNYQLPRLQ